MAEVVLRRPHVRNVVFDYKTGKTKEGWPLEHIKGGDLHGLTWYFLFYAARQQYPQAVTDEKLGLDPDYVRVFLSMYLCFTTTAEVLEECATVLQRGLELQDASVRLQLLAGLTAMAAPDAPYVDRLPHKDACEWLSGLLNLLLLVEDTLAVTSATPLEQEAYAQLQALMQQFQQRVNRAGALLGQPTQLQHHVADLAPSSNAAVAEGWCTHPEISSQRYGWSASSSSSSAALLSPMPQLPSGIVYGSLWSLPPATLAAQWTAYEHSLFRSIPAWEWLGFGWDKARHEHAADGIRRYIDHFNACCLWVTAEVLAQPSARERAAMIVRFLKVAHCLRRYGNFSALVEISMGLKRDSVSRMHRTWALVPQSAKQVWAEILEVTDDKQNYRAYKSTLRGVKPSVPVVPHLAAHTSEIAVQEQLLPTTVPAPAASAAQGVSTLLHFRRYRELAGMLAPLLAMQAVGYEAACDSRSAANDASNSLPGLHVGQVGLLLSALRPFYSFSEEDRERAVARLMQWSHEIEPDALIQGSYAPALQAARLPTDRRVDPEAVEVVCNAYSHPELNGAAYWDRMTQLQAQMQVQMQVQMKSEQQAKNSKQRNKGHAPDVLPRVGSPRPA